MEHLIEYVVFWVNAALIVALAVYYGRKPVKRLVKNYNERVEASIERAEANRREAEDERNNWQERWREIGDEADQIVDRAQDVSERQRREIIEQGAAEEEHLRNRVRTAIQRDRDRALQSLRHEVSQLLIDSVASGMSRVVTPGDHERLANEFISEVGDWK